MVELFENNVQELLAVFSSKELIHKDLYLEMLQMEEILNLLLQRTLLLKNRSRLTKEQIKMELQDTLNDLRLGRRKIVDDLKKLTALQAQILNFI